MLLGRIVIWVCSARTECSSIYIVAIYKMYKFSLRCDDGNSTKARRSYGERYVNMTMPRAKIFCKIDKRLRDTNTLKLAGSGGRSRCGSADTAAYSPETIAVLAWSFRRHSWTGQYQFTSLNTMIFFLPLVRNMLQSCSFRSCKGIFTDF